MVFSSLEFILLFVPIFFSFYYLAPKEFRNFVLLIGSLVFYFVGTIKNPEHYILFILTIVADFMIARAMQVCPKHKKALLVSGIVFHITVLSCLKYLDFILNELHNFINTPSINIVLPIGISFYTFQGMSYLIDVYRGKIKVENSLLRYAVYIAMFEQLIAGPIVTYSKVQKDLRQRNISNKLITTGLATFIFGLGLKVLLANPLGKLWSQTCAIGFESITTPLAWISIIAFSFQIYFDFFGYSLMAIGLGKMLGFSLPKNFDHPYTSVSMTEFWRRWHMTLGSWFREYVYIPLGGNRKGLVKTIFNLLVVWLLTGIWHGAGYNFVLWGLFLFSVISIEKFVFKDFFEKHRTIGHLYMFVLIPVSWAIFQIDNLQNLSIFLGRLFPFFSNYKAPFANDYMKYLADYFPFLIAGIILSFQLPYKLMKRIKNNYIITGFCLVILIGCIYCMYRGLDDPFLYFRF